jgi:uncharacterized heparinase superfamily protein
MGWTHCRTYFGHTGTAALSIFRKVQLYWHTLRYLKPVQIWGRVTFRLLRPKPDLRPAPAVRQSSGPWQTPAARRVSMLSPSRFRFLNVEHEIPAPTDWNSIQLPKLWLYNLHYFDDLNAEGAAYRVEWHRDLITRWIIENSPGQGTGWEPYPLSLRIINWIKWTLAGNALDEVARHSLAVQVRFLTQRLERHLLGNHLFVNAKALVFAGCYFEGEEAESWLRLGMGILDLEIPEQILADGGHFERSTMYHALAYEDMLDLHNLSHAFPNALLPWQCYVTSWTDIIVRMGCWLHAMSHPDGEIAFFNDAAVGVAPSPPALFAYAQRLRLTIDDTPRDIIHLEPSGYIRVMQGQAVLLIDAAPIGPDYLPGHAHADTLSYELSLCGQRVIVNSGISRYGMGPEREWERSTAAHNTVEIDGQNSSEVWAGFRVARRAFPFNVAIKKDGTAVTIEAAHDGYRRLPGKPVHKRRWILRAEHLIIEDIIEGVFSEAVSRIYFHPNIFLDGINNSGTLQFQRHNLSWQVDGAATSLKAASWHPSLGRSLRAYCLELSVQHQNQAARCSYRISWSGHPLRIR